MRTTTPKMAETMPSEHSDDHQG